jgi:DNA-binding response OmpR family regulator
MANGALVTTERLYNGLYASRFSSENIPDIKIVDVHICKLRKKIELYGVYLRRVHGQGTMIDTDSRQTARARLEDHARSIS